MWFLKQVFSVRFFVGAFIGRFFAEIFHKVFSVPLSLCFNWRRISMRHLGEMSWSAVAHGFFQCTVVLRWLFWCLILLKRFRCAILQFSSWPTLLWLLSWALLLGFFKAHFAGFLCTFLLRGVSRCFSPHSFTHAFLGNSMRHFAESFCIFLPASMLGFFQKFFYVLFRRRPSKQSVAWTFTVLLFSASFACAIFWSFLPALLCNF